MINRSPQSKHLPGEVPAVGHWFENRPATRQAAKSFTAAPGMVPTNPQNYQSALPQPAPFVPKYDTIGDGLTLYSNPYGDGYAFAAPQLPQRTVPAPAAAVIQAPPPAPGAELQLGTPGYGFGAGSPLTRIDAAQQQTPRGMSTSPSLVSGGPQRDVPKPA